MTIVIIFIIIIFKLYNRTNAEFKRSRTFSFNIQPVPKCEGFIAIPLTEEPKGQNACTYFEK